jgi:hypothetical protein
MLGRLLGLLSIPLTALALWGLIRQTGKERPLRISTPVVGLVMAPITLLINLVVLRQAAPGFLGPGLLLFGLGLGLAWGQATRIYARDQRLVGKRTAWHLVFWGISYAFTQILATVARAQWVSAGLAAMFFSAGSTLGTNLNLLVRLLRSRSALKPIAMPVSALVSPPRTLPERGPKPRDLPEAHRAGRPGDLPERPQAGRT